jgi:hypothetical protein
VSGPDLRASLDSDVDDAPVAPSLLRRPPVLLLLALLVVALVAERHLLPGTGPALAGGRLLPAPRTAVDLWSDYAGPHAPPELAVLAALATVLAGRAGLAVDVVLLLSVPLAGLSAYLCAGRLVRGTALRLWAGATWALLPVATAGTATGRLDVAVAQVLLPPLLVLGAGVLRADPRESRWRRPWATGLLLAVVVAVSPVLELLAAVLLVGGALLGRAASAPGVRDLAGRRLRAALLVVAVPVLVLLPALPDLVADPGAVLHGPGRLGPGLATAVAAPGLALLRPGGPAVPPQLLTGGLLLGALGGVVRRHRRPALLGWAVALVGLTAAEVLVRVVADGAQVWPGAALQLCAAGLLVAALVAGDGARARLAQSAFGSRQLAAAAVAVLAALTPVLLAGAWVARGADGPLTRAPRTALPAFVSAELAEQPGVRALVLAARGDGSLGYGLVGGAGSRLGDPPVEPAEARRRDALVADLLSPRGSTAAEALSVRAVRWVALQGDPALVPVLDAQTGLVRRSDDPVPLWQVVAPAARLTVLPPATAALARTGAAGPTDTVPAPVPVGRTLPAGPDGRLLVLAEPVGAGWTATLDGGLLRGVPAWGGLQAFELPSSGGPLRVAHARGLRPELLGLQALALAAAVALAVRGLPARGRS